MIFSLFVAMGTTSHAQTQYDPCAPVVAARTAAFVPFSSGGPARLTPVCARHLRQLFITGSARFFDYLDRVENLDPAGFEAGPILSSHTRFNEDQRLEARHLLIAKGIEVRDPNAVLWRFLIDMDEVGLDDVEVERHLEYLVSPKVLPHLDPTRTSLDGSGVYPIERAKRLPQQLEKSSLRVRLMASELIQRLSAR